MNSSSAALMLCPVDPHWINTDINHTIEILKKIEFIRNTLPNQTKHYFVGEKFFDLIAFMGCAPNIRLAPEQGIDSFTHIQLINSPAEMLFQYGRHTRPPHCPTCQKPDKNWPDKNIHADWLCRHCHQKSKPWFYHWRKSAGFAHCFIKITDVYPKEAIPQSQLLTELEKEHGVSWQYFYI